MVLPSRTARHRNARRGLHLYEPAKAPRRGFVWERLLQMEIMHRVISVSDTCLYPAKGVSSMKEIPIWEKSNLTLEEAAAYSGIGINKLRDLTNDQNCRFVLWVGNKRLIKRRLFDQYIEQAYSI